jgi:hypothetical protein
MDMESVSAGDTDITVEVCGDGTIEVSVTDGVEMMAGGLDVEAAEQLIEMLQRAIEAARS